MLNQKRLVLGYPNITLSQIKRILQDLHQYAGSKFTTGIKRHVLKNVLHKSINPTNAHRLFKMLEKLGYIQNNRLVEITPVTRDWFHNKNHYSELESHLSYHTYGQAILLRQLLKIRAVKDDSTQDVKPFLVAFHLLSQYKTISLANFNYILEALGSSEVTCINIDKMIKHYQDILTSKHPVKAFQNLKETYFKTKTPNLAGAFLDAYNYCKKYLNYKQLTTHEQKIFKTAFQINETSAPKAFKFIRDLRRYPLVHGKKQNHIIMSLLKLSHSNTIRNAFGNQRVIFSSLKKHKISDFKRKYKHCKLLQGKEYYIYTFCENARKHTRIKANASITDNTLRLTSLVTIKNGRISLKNDCLWNGLFKISKAHEKVNHSLNDNLRERVCLHQILKLTSVHDAIKVIKYATQYTKENRLKKIMESRRFNNFINANYNYDKLITALQLCKAHYHLKKNKHNSYQVDNELRSLISNHSNYADTHASVPTIFEYLTGIAWYFLTNRAVHPLNACNLIFENFYPKVHAQGGMPDINFYNAKKHLHVLFEVTLMTPHDQERSEIVPDILHTQQVENKALEHNKRAKTVTFYIANSSDKFTVTQFLAQKNIPELKNGKGLNIVPLTINDLIKFLRLNHRNSKAFNATYLLNHLADLRKKVATR